MKMPLPALREELALLAGPMLADGQPSHTLHDPVRNQFFQIDWPTFEMLRRWPLGEAGAVADAVGRDTTLQLGQDDVEQALLFLRENQLLRPPAGASADYADRLRQRRGSWGHRLLHNYLFFRVSLVRPDAWLARWTPRLSLFHSRLFLGLTLAALGWGTIEIFRQWDAFSATLVDTISWRGVLSYGIALTAVKVLHELGHAMTAKRFGCRVPTMGVAFLVLWPVAYTDTNEVWKLTDHRQRLAVVGAGVLTELAVAAWSTLAWALLPEGTLKSLAFLLATTTLMATLLINASPFMRFDGYFLLSDWLQIPNLHARAFALARWDLRERLFALGQAAPEHFPRPRRIGLILFAYATWIYRLTVFLGIAALVYAFFIKAVGIFLFIIEIGWFVLRPFSQELKAWQTLWPAIRHSRRTRVSAAIALLLALSLVVPWPARISTSALLRPAMQLVLYAPPGAQVSAMPVTEGQHVAAGTLLLTLSSAELEGRLRAARARERRLQWQISSAPFDPEQRAQWQVAQEQLGAVQAEIAAIQADAVRYAPVAPFAGVLRDLSPDLRAGVWLSRQEPLARLVSDQGLAVVTYLDEDQIGQVRIGDKARFHADAPEGPSATLEVTGIDRDASRILREPELASLFGGTIIAREKNGQIYPERPVYRVTLTAGDVRDSARQHAWRGTVVLDGQWAVPAWRYLRGALAVIRREAGF
ncbi:HlyD family efflux transporter periplasmic adaptor subunit [Herbaspirillum sp. alder98]|uniref:HlyD family efflux transporter periplasmic adaptor subunit n=1 Tax=Herbaspirillum sp. alder98 TaxID=2913096 RepID=UPI001CD85219|nr:HlyD family efflux transporter periplasmic adaptor subunit [Herbaspirillum sp. alder98]MCA1325161.1 HlyD family efflux transporter periplasmic adaptor subunit [Herbaspirillum sp. alder98]